MALISGTVYGHGEENPTKIYPVQIRVTDNIDEDEVNPFCQVTAFRVTNVSAISAPPGFTTLGTTPVLFTVTVSGVGAGPNGRDLLWSVIDDDGWLNGGNDELQHERTFNTGPGTGTTGTWSITLEFYLHKNTARNVAGADGQSGESTAEIFVRIEGDYGGNWMDSPVRSVTVTPP